MNYNLVYRRGVVWNSDPSPLIQPPFYNTSFMRKTCGSLGLYVSYKIVIISYKLAMESPAKGIVMLGGVIIGGKIFLKSLPLLTTFSEQDPKSRIQKRLRAKEYLETNYAIPTRFELSRISGYNLTEDELNRLYPPPPPPPPPPLNLRPAANPQRPPQPNPTPAEKPKRKPTDPNDIFRQFFGEEQKFFGNHPPAQQPNPRPAPTPRQQQQQQSPDANQIFDQFFGGDPMLAGMFGNPKPPTPQPAPKPVQPAAHTPAKSREVQIQEYLKWCTDRGEGLLQMRNQERFRDLALEGTPQLIKFIESEASGLSFSTFTQRHGYQAIDLIQDDEAKQKLAIVFKVEMQVDHIGILALNHHQGLKLLTPKQVEQLKNDLVSYDIKRLFFKPPQTSYLDMKQRHGLDNLKKYVVEGNTKKDICLHFLEELTSKAVFHDDKNWEEVIDKLAEDYAEDLQWFNIKDLKETYRAIWEKSSVIQLLQDRNFLFMFKSIPPNFTTKKQWEEKIKRDLQNVDLPHLLKGIPDLTPSELLDIQAKFETEVLMHPTLESFVDFWDKTCKFEDGMSLLRKCNVDLKKCDKLNQLIVTFIRENFHYFLTQQKPKNQYYDIVNNVLYISEELAKIIAEARSAYKQLLKDFEDDSIYSVSFLTSLYLQCRMTENRLQAFEGEINRLEESYKKNAKVKDQLDSCKKLKEQLFTIWKNEKAFFERQKQNSRGFSTVTANIHFRNTEFLLSQYVSLLDKLIKHEEHK